MNNLSLKQKIMIVVGIVGAILIAIFQHGLYSKPAPVSLNSNTLQNSPTTLPKTNLPQIISTNPSPLEEAIIWAMQPVEITFNTPLENIPEFKYRFEPEVKMEVKLSNNNQTVTFTPKEPLKLGSVFTLFISPESKFQGKKTLGKEYIYHFRTIEYKGV